MSVADALIPHLAGRPVTVGAADGSVLGVEQVDTADDLSFLVDRGVVTLATSLPDVQQAAMPGVRTVACCTLHIAAGEGTGIATAATAALALCEAMTADGLTAVVTTDGGEGLYVRAMGPRTRRRSVETADRARVTDPVRTGMDGPWEIASGYAEDLARRAPEIATVDPRQADGRALIDASPSWPGNVTPVPYSLVPASATPAAPVAPVAPVAPTAPSSGVGHGQDCGCVVPLDLDELAATTAGMPMDPGPLDVAGRLAAKGDLAGALLDGGDDPRVG